MLFTVITPSHQRKKLLKKLLDSFTEQTFKDFEVIIVATEGDEAFDLESEKYSFPVEFCFIPNDPTGGRSASLKRNFGAQRAQGQWLAFTDDDCLTSPQWLEEAYKAIRTGEYQMLEGGVNIPTPEKATFPYKGILRLSQPGGYQTCNMFYLKEAFLKLGGFDKNFPYYLEDTDLAWTFLENGYKAHFAEKAMISHPVPPPVTKKMLESAFRLEKLPYLKKKHPNTFSRSRMRALPRPYLILIINDLLLFLSLLFCPLMAAGVFITRLLITLALLMRMLRGCHFQWAEFASMYYYLIICPLISLFSLIKGSIKQGEWLLIR